MNEKSDKLSLFTLISFGTAAFAMHFGSSCMLWPVTWGQQSGSSVFSAMAGIFLTAILMPFAAYIAMLRSDSSFWGMLSSLKFRRFGLVFGSLTIAVLGPLFVIPRMSMAAWDALCQVVDVANPHPAATIVFQVVYYVVAYWFLFKQTEIMDKIGKYLTPILVITVIAVVVRSLASPLAERVPKFYEESGFQYGLISGYQTMDLPGSLVFGGIIIINLRAKGLEGKSIMKNLLIVTGIGFAMLTLSHCFQMVVGANTGDMFVNVSYARLYATIILELWGRVGGALFNVGLLLASMTSTIGLSSGCAEFFVEASEKKLDYRKTAIVILVISTALACFKLDTIIALAGPVLNLIYPPCIALVLGYIIFANDAPGAITWATVLAFIWGLIDCITGYAAMAGADLTGFNSVYNLMPFAAAGVGWIIPTLIGGILGYVILDRNRATNASTI